MNRLLSMVLLVVGVSLAAAFGSRNGEQHTEYRMLVGVVADLQALQGELEECKDDECRVEPVQRRVESGALREGQSVEDALAVAEAAVAAKGLPAPLERLVAWAMRGGLGWMFGCVLIVIGAVMARRQQTAEATGADDATEERVHFPAVLAQLRAELERLAADIAELPMEDDAPAVREKLEDIEADLILPVVDARMQLVARHGIGAFAEYFSPFSAGERNLNRTWSALTDGHAVVAREALAEARRSFDQAAAEWDAVELRAGLAAK